jgi:hypothetical protein
MDASSGDELAMKRPNNRGCYRQTFAWLCATGLAVAATAAAAQGQQPQAQSGTIVLQGMPGAPAQLRLQPQPSIVVPVAPAPAAPQPPTVQAAPAAAAPAPPAAPAEKDARAVAAPAAEASLQPQPPGPGGFFPPQPPPPQRGLFNNWATWWQDPFGSLNSKSKDAQSKVGGNADKTSADAAKNAAQNAAQNAAAATTDAMRNAAAATTDAALAIARLPAARVVEARKRCPLAPNGAPDCQVAATDVCRGKGFGGGKPLDVQSSRACPPQAYASGRIPAMSECPEETVVLRALCQ